MSLPSDVQVLIVGAGPTGLTAAITLAQLGLPFVIVDSSPRNQNGSRAAVVHSYTLEVLDTIGVAQPIIETGIRCDGIVFRGGTDKILEFDLSQLRDATAFPFSVLIPQHDVEGILRARLAAMGIHVLQHHTAVGLRASEHEQDTGMDVMFEDGSVVRAQYVIGADGSRSTIRGLAGIQFTDPHTGVLYDDTSVSPSFHIVLADVYLADPLPVSLSTNTVSTHLDNFLLLIPLRATPTTDTTPGPTTPATPATPAPAPAPRLFWRVGFLLPAGGPRPPKHPSQPYLQHLLDACNPWPTPLTITSLLTSSSYRVRTAVAARYFAKVGGGNVLLAGDAAHVHSPAGGQGMNLGMCDAVAVAHAVEVHVVAQAQARAAGDMGAVGEGGDVDGVLRRYGEGRRRVGVRVVGLARGLTMLANANTGWRRVLRNWVLGVVSWVPWVNRYMAWRISGLVNRGM